MFRFLFSPNGRISRADMWLKYLLPYIGLQIAASIVDRSMGGWQMIHGGYTPDVMMHSHHGPVSAVLSLFYLWPGLVAVPVKRFHDRGMTGWWQLIFIVLAGVGCAILLAGLPWHQLMEVNTHDELREAIHSIPREKTLLMLAGCLELVVVGLTVFVIEYLLPGQQGENKYGPDPRDRSG